MGLTYVEKLEDIRRNQFRWALEAVLNYMYEEYIEGYDKRYLELALDIINKYNFEHGYNGRKWYIK